MTPETDTLKHNLDQLDIWEARVLFYLSQDLTPQERTAAEAEETRIKTARAQCQRAMRECIDPVEYAISQLEEKKCSSQR